LTQAAAGLAQMRVGLVVLTETKLVDDRHPKTASGFSIMCLKTLIGHQGGVALMWKEDNGPNIVTFQVTTEDERFYDIGTYIPLDCIKGVDHLWKA